jgi:hypothetical protein
LQRVLNGGGRIEREYAAGRGRMDLAVEYNNKFYTEARQKEADLELVYISEILTSMPQSEFETVTWTNKRSWQDIYKLLQEELGSP